MHIVPINVLFVLILLSLVAHAQNSDLGLLVGVLTPESQVVAGSDERVSVNTGASGQLNYGLQLLSTRAGNVYLEFPFVLASSGVAAGGSSVSLSDRRMVTFTPGLRFKVFIDPRVVFYGAAGAGVGSFGTEELRINGGVTTHSRRTTTAVLGFGGGIEFRLTRLLSFRGEVRDFVSRAGLGGVEGRHHTVIGTGVAFHF